jgi:peroxisomal enoyl-CoA hydratase 2
VAQEPGKSLGFGGPVMHGLFTYNHAAHAVLKEIGGSNPANLREFGARFSAPVRLGDILVTKIWKLGVFQGEFEEVRFITLVNGKAVLTNGMALIRPRSNRESKVWDGGRWKDVL